MQLAGEPGEKGVGATRRRRGMYTDDKNLREEERKWYSMAVAVVLQSSDSERTSLGRAFDLALMLWCWCCYLSQEQQNSSSEHRRRMQNMFED